MPRNLLLPAGLLSVLSALLLITSVAQSPAAASAIETKSSAFVPLGAFLVLRRHEMPMQQQNLAGAENPTVNFHAVSVAPSPRVQPILPVFLQSNIQPQHSEIANEVFTLFPEQCRSVLTNFYVRYGPQDRRGYAGAHTAIISGDVSNAEFRALAGHEFGHVIDLGCLTGTPESGDSSFHDGSETIHNDDPSLEFYKISWVNEHTMRPDAKAAAFVSGYAQTDPYEDATETITARIFENNMLVARAKTNPAIARKLQWVNTYVFPNGINVATGEAWNGKKDIPWDITKMAYVWNAAGNVAMR